MQTVDPLEIEHFKTLARHWWDEDGPFKTLHQLNPVRIDYILKYIQQHFNVSQKKLESLRFLDVGCGGGLLSEPLARLGAHVTALDAVAENIAFAQQHAQEMGLTIHYIHSCVEDFQDQPFDVVTALEILEHVQNPALFIQHCCRLVRPGGLLFFSTINRTFKAYVLAIKIAEDILNLIPRGTHQWQKFLRPKEIEKYLTQNNCKILNRTGIKVDLLHKTMKLTDNCDVNYMMVAQKEYL